MTVPAVHMIRCSSMGFAWDPMQTLGLGPLGDPAERGGGCNKSCSTSATVPLAFSDT